MITVLSGFIAFLVVFIIITLVAYLQLKFANVNEKLDSLEETIRRMCPMVKETRDNSRRCALNANPYTDKTPSEEARQIIKNIRD